MVQLNQVITKDLSNEKNMWIRYSWTHYSNSSDLWNDFQWFGLTLYLDIPYNTSDYFNLVITQSQSSFVEIYLPILTTSQYIIITKKFYMYRKAENTVNFEQCGFEMRRSTYMRIFFPMINTEVLQTLQLIELLDMESQIFVCSSFSCVQLFATPWTVARQAPLSLEFSGQECWSGLPFSSPADM